MTSLPKQDYLLSNSTTNTNNNTNNNNTLNRRRSETNTDDINYEPMSRLPDDKKPGSIPKKSESLTLRVSDETRVASAIYEASKKRKTGSIYSLSIQLSSNGTLGLGVKALKNNILVISMLKRVGGQLGPGEAAGVRLGDIVVGVNFKPCRDGVRSLLSALNQATDNNETIVQLQCWRCHQLCSDSIPGSLFPRCDDILVQGYTLYRTKVFSDWERWNFIEIMLRHMREELEFRIQSTGNALQVSNSYPKIRAIHNQLLDLERNILQAKGLRTALCVRIVHTSFVDDAVVYVLRIEDVESGRQWSIRRRYRDFFGLHGDLLRMSHYTQDIPFPKKKLVSLRTSSRIIEERIVALEQFIRMAIHRLTHYSTMDAHASQSLRRMQQFLDVGEFVDSLNPPPFDDQRYLELMVYRHLNDFSSLSCQQCIRFVDSVNLDSLVTTGNDGYQPVLTLLSQALLEVEEYTLQQFGQQMTQVLSDRRPDSNPEMIRVFVRRCVRRQVESAVYLPLRRAVFRIVYSFIAIKAQKLQQAIRVLKNAPTSLFFQGLDVEGSEKLNPAINAFRDLVSAYLPADQSHALMQAAGAVMELHSDCIQRAKQQKLQREKSLNELSTTSNIQSNIKSSSISTSSPSPSTSSNILDSNNSQHNLNDLQLVKSDSNTSDVNDIDIMTNMLNKSVLADPASTIFSAPEHVLIEKRNFDEHLKLSTPDGEHQSTSGNDHFFGEKSAIKYSGVDLRKNKSPSPKKQSIYDRIDDNQGDSGEVLLEGLLRQSVDARSISVDNYDKMVTIRGSSRLASGLSRQFSLDSTIWEHNPPLSSQLVAEKSFLSSNDEGDEYRNDEDDDNNNDNSNNNNNINDNQNNQNNNSNNDSNNNNNQMNSNQSTDIPDDLDDRIDVNADNQEQEEEEDLYPIRCTIVDSQDFLNDSISKPSESKEGIDTKNYTVVGADDFLPMFVYVLVRADLPQLILVKDIMITLVDNEEMYGECGYYMATLEAAIQHIVHMADDYNSSLSHNNK